MRVLITGCSTGIGRATAIELADRGFEVVATARDVKTLAGLDAVQLPLDVDEDESVRAAVEAAGEIDVLVNNAAFGVIGPIETVPIDDVRAMFETNVFGALRMVRAVVPGMRDRGRGHIVNVSSVAGRMAATPLNGLYAATKHALEALGETMWRELRHFHIRVSLVEPGYVATAWPRNEEWFGADGPYEDLYRQVRAADEDGQAGAEPPQVIAEVIAAAIEHDGDRLRWPAGEGGEAAIRFRNSLNDQEWEQFVSENTSLDW